VLKDISLSPQSATLSSCQERPGVEENQMIVHLVRTWLNEVLKKQVLDGSVNDGGFDEWGTGWCDGRHGAYTLGRLIAARAFKGGSVFAGAGLDEAIVRLLDFVLRRQNARGELDLEGAYSPNEAGFPVPALVEGMKRLQEDPSCGAICERLQTFLLLAGEAILHGNAYTANHRWAAAAGPLACLNSLWPDDRYLQKIEDYLSDGIDCDEDGCWYEERSGIYSGVANYAMIVLAENLGRPELLDHVVRSLEFNLRCGQPNGELDTTFSHRQDRGQAGRLLSGYQIPRRMAILTGRGDFAWLADRARSKGIHVEHELYPLLYEIEKYPGPLPAPTEPPTSYENHFCGIQVFRKRVGPAALTLSADRGGHYFDSVLDQWGGLRRSEDWFHLMHGEAVLQTIRFCPAAGRPIQPDRLRIVDSGEFRLGGQMEHWMHTLHFRKGWPKIPMPAGLEHEIEIAWRGRELTLNLAVRSPQFLYGTLALWVRCVGAVREGGRRLEGLVPGQAMALQGGQPVEIEAGGAIIEIIGLPVAEHRIHGVAPDCIPSQIRKHSTPLLLGLTLPVKLELKIRLSETNHPQLLTAGANGQAP